MSYFAALRGFVSEVEDRDIGLKLWLVRESAVVRMDDSLQR